MHCLPPAAIARPSDMKAAPLVTPQAEQMEVVATWPLALAQRMRTLWLPKMVGTMLGIPAFFWFYFLVLRHPLNTVRVMPFTSLDAWFDLHEAALPLYASLWLYVAIAPAFAKNAIELRAYLRGAAAMSVSGLAFFWLVPTRTPPVLIDWVRYPALEFLKSVDASGNAFPSMHVSFAVFTAVLIASALRAVAAPVWLRALNWLWAFGIVYSTLATRQHVLLDVAGGVALGVMACAVTFYSRGMNSREKWLKRPVHERRQLHKR